MAFSRDVISSRNLVATLDGDNVVRIYELETLQKIATFSVETDFGGSRLALAPDGKMIAAGEYGTGRLTLHRSDGTKAWEREALDELQSVRFSLDSQTVYCSHHRGLVSAFDVNTGQLSRFGWFRKHLVGLKKLYESPHDDLSVHDRMERPLQFATSKLDPICDVDRKSFAVLDVAFAPEFVCVSESGAPISCYHANGTPVWEAHHSKGVHALRLAYDEERKLFLAITWPFETGGAQSLLTIQPTSGDIVDCFSFTTDYTHYFAGNGAYVVNVAGDVYSSVNLESVGRLEP
ncbi:WD40 repeat domain-containing protein [Novipirellula galeiformis]|nr:hypothetical protein [Novipirellula galeiformis]